MILKQRPAADGRRGQADGAGGPKNATTRVRERRMVSGRVSERPQWAGAGEP